MTFDSCNSCSGNKQEEGGPTPFEQELEASDSLEAAKLIDQFFEYAMQEKYYDAAGMLFKYNEERRTADPEQLDNDEMEKVVQSLKMIRPVDYKINFMKFSQYYDNEIEVTAYMAKGENGMPDVTTKMYFKPFRGPGKWVLMLIDTHEYNNPVVDNKDRDSVMNAYQQHKSDTLKKNKRY